MKGLSASIFLLTAFFFAGCAPTLPPQSSINATYSIADVKTFSSVLDCEHTQATEVRQGFAQDYCQVLAGNIKLAIQQANRNFSQDEVNPDLLVQSVLEEIHGGNAAARFWVGFGAGRSITTIYVKVLKKGEIIAERRITETTTMPNLVTGTYANEDAILQDAPLVARKIADFVHNPAEFEKKQSGTDQGSVR
jgi:hypothetical protein